MAKAVTSQSKKHDLFRATTESVADILEYHLESLIHDWMALVERQEDLRQIKLSFQERTGHLPQLLRDVIIRLRMHRDARAPLSIAAGHHGNLRRRQGYSVAMVVEESRLLQVCLFTTLHKYNHRLEYSKLLLDVVIIADEVDAQLKQQILFHMEANAIGNQPKVL